jgi:hypothetical protein
MARAIRKGVTMIAHIRHLIEQNHSRIMPIVGELEPAGMAKHI